MQDICKEWESKPASEKQFEPFYRAVSAVAHSSGTRLKTRVVLLNQMLKAQQQKSRDSIAKGILPPIERSKTEVVSEDKVLTSHRHHHHHLNMMELALPLVCWNQNLKAFANSLDPDETPQKVAAENWYV
ncbi:hypothetical protein DPMN_170961 [Dreissena polymorpha]|uniref:Uncharacterized protein n=1 Tax=Dreissena polymorpha TaxID=45954 RepID=A0A9D4IEQ9_DREPO|nr:hypothetical protein DPMN_170961 [Dreissena polymorpha]